MDIDKYCQNPSRYSLPKETKEYYDQICLSRKNVTKHNNELRKWLVKNSKTIGEKGLSFVKFTSTLVSNLIQGMLSPQGLEYMGIFYGINLGAKVAGSLILRALVRGLATKVWEDAVAMATEKGAMFVSNTVMATALAKGAEESATALALKNIAEGVSQAFDEITFILTIVMLLGIVLDAIDRQGFGKQLDASMLDYIGDQLDQLFTQKFLSVNVIGKDAFGRDLHYAHWPVEYSGISLEAYINQVLSKEDQDEYQLKYYKYMVEYTESLKINSDGYSICWPQGGQLITEDEFFTYVDSFSMILADRNTVVAEWLHKYWLIVVFLLLLLIIFILTIR